MAGPELRNRYDTLDAHARLIAGLFYAGHRPLQPIRNVEITRAVLDSSKAAIKTPICAMEESRILILACRSCVSLLPLLIRSMRSHPRSYATPRATGRAGSAIHSLQDPGYSRAPSSPPTAMASALWQAVTPLPH